MRKYSDILNKIINEATRPTATASATKTDDLESLLGLDAEVVNGELVPASEPAARQVATPPSINSADGAKTRASLSGGVIPAEALAIGADLTNLEIEDEISDHEAARLAGLTDNHGHTVTGAWEPTVATTPENLPVVLNQYIQGHGDPQFANRMPEFHQVKHLPGYLNSAIRQIGRTVFRQFTTTPIEDIQMMCDVKNPYNGRPLLNSEHDLHKMAAWIVQNGQKEDGFSFDFAAHLPAYASVAGVAESQLWRACGYQFLMMKDNGGNYIYAWPENHAQLVDHGGQTLDQSSAALGRPPLRLEGHADIAEAFSMYSDVLKAEDVLKEANEKLSLGYASNGFSIMMEGNETNFGIVLGEGYLTVMEGGVMPHYEGTSLNDAAETVTLLLDQ